MKSQDVIRMAEQLYEEMGKLGIEALFDDRLTSPGFKFKDADLLGMPIQVIVGEKNLANGNVEIKIRKTGERLLSQSSDVINKVKDLLS